MELNLFIYIPITFACLKRLFVEVERIFPSHPQHFKYKRISIGTQIHNHVFLLSHQRVLLCSFGLFISRRRSYTTRAINIWLPRLYPHHFQHNGRLNFGYTWQPIKWTFDGVLMCSEAHRNTYTDKHQYHFEHSLRLQNEKKKSINERNVAHTPQT